jgi:hypothetical protein
MVLTLAEYAAVAVVVILWLFVQQVWSDFMAGPAPRKSITNKCKCCGKYPQDADFPHLREQRRFYTRFTGNAKGVVHYPPPRPRYPTDGFGCKTDLSAGDKVDAVLRREKHGVAMLQGTVLSRDDDRNEGACYRIQFTPDDDSDYNYVMGDSSVCRKKTCGEGKATGGGARMHILRSQLRLLERAPKKDN